MFVVGLTGVLGEGLTEACGGSVKECCHLANLREMIKPARANPETVRGWVTRVWDRPTAGFPRKAQYVCVPT